MTAPNPTLAAWLKSAESGPVERHGIRGSARAWMLASLLRARAREGHDARPIIVVTEDDAGARALHRDACYLLGIDPGAHPIEAPLVHLPEDESLPFDGVPADRDVELRRMGVLFRLASGAGALGALVTSARALLRKVIPREVIDAHTELLMVGEEMEREKLLAHLTLAGYERVGAVEAPGHFAVRGFVIDAWPSIYSAPLRATFFGDEVESLRFFDPGSQLALGKSPVHQPEAVYLPPVREVIFDGDRVTIATERVQQRADELSHPSRMTRAVLEEIGRGVAFFGIAAILPAFYPTAEPVLAYLPRGEGAQWLIDDPSAVFRIADDLEDRLKDRADLAITARTLVFDPGEYFAPAEALQAAIADAPRLELSPGAGRSESSTDPGHHGIGGLRAEIEARRGDEQMLEPLVKRLREWHGQGRGAVMVCADAHRADRFVSMMRDLRIEARRVPDAGCLVEPSQVGRMLRPSVHVFVTVGQLSEGLVPGDLPIAIVAETDVFGQRQRREVRPRRETPFKTRLEDLTEGDFIVHVDFGIGEYQGLKRIAAGGKEGDYLLVIYKGGDKLYLPAERIGAMQRYIAPGGGSVRLDKMGGDAWQRTKQKVKKALTALAGELLQLYAQRELRSGHAFSPPDIFYREFESDFEFEETPDQQRAVDDVLADLQKPAPMDRLVCGDVGYGKTEVAMRAAFKVVEDGFQVAVLVPTTVLAQQHYRTFRKRFEGYPVQIRVLSRFLTAGEQKQVIQDAAEGRVDVLIGTHRLLQRDIKFKQLGLFVVDEEQRFGVKDKERIKRLSAAVDCLTLSATPIPRTMHLSMVGLRDLSVIATPPEDRLAVRTTVSRFDGRVIRDAIMRELERGGQVYFIHNRIGSMPALKEYLQKVVPEARIGHAHGRMDGATLEEVMVRFVEREYDVLLSTAIVESGLDIPAANTIIMNRADQFGLAQLYQLRGRVGRSRERAYAYLMVPAKTLVTPTAQKRLNTLSRFSELGAGFQIASHDLEMRGAGDLLGRKQHGHMAAVGFELYTEILKEAVDELRGKGGTAQRPEPELKSTLQGFVPEAYVPDVAERLTIYRSLSSATTLAELEAVDAALDDRFGQQPEEMRKLVRNTEVKVRARELGATYVELAKTRLVLTLAEDTPIDRDKVLQLIHNAPRRWQLRKDDEIVARPSAGPPWEPVEDEAELMTFARRALKSLGDCAN